MKKQLFALFAVIAMAFTANAQTVKVSGTVSDANGPLPGAAIMVKGTTNGTIADIDGNYTINAAPNGVLEFSCMGYETIEQAINGRGTINVTLSEDSTVLADAVVLGYGIATKKKDLSAAVGIVASPEQLAQHPVTSTTAMLQGQIPGVTVQSNGGDPTAGQSLVIRGQGSPNGDSVLWVVDGVPGAPINSMNDIESIVVLKDAASAAIYGAQSGAGGVIIVTTKKGTQGVSLSYDGLVGMRQAAKLPTPLTAEQQLDIVKQAYSNANLPLPEGWDVTKNPYIGTTRTNWMDEVFRTALYHRHNVAFSAGTEKLKNRVSLSLEDNQGVLYNTYNKRLGINYRGEFQINKWIKLYEDFNWSTSEGRGADTDAATTGIIVNAIQMPSSAEVHQYDGTGWGGTTTEDPEYIAKYGSNFSGIHGIVQNPLRQLYGFNSYSGNANFYTTTGLEIANIVKGLRFNSKFTYSTGSAISKRFNYSRPEVGDPSLNTSLDLNSSRSDNWKTENTLTFDRTFGKHTVGALAATTADHASSRGFSANGKTFADEVETLQFLKYASSKSADDWFSGPDANVAIITRASYSYDDRYFVTASWRRDYAGRLPQGHNFGDFPAVTGAWKISSEPWFNNQGAMNFFKIRASFGRVGNLGSIGWNYKSSILSTSTNTSASIYGTENAGTQFGAMVWNDKALNPNLTWETSQQFNVGVDLGFFNDRLNASIDYYRKKTYNLIQPQTMNWPDAIGVSNMTVNLGDIANRGVEFTLGWSDKVGDFSYYVNGNAAYNKNIVLNIGVTDADGNPASWDSSWQYRDVRFYNKTIQGGPLNQIYIIKCLGVFQNQAEVDAHSKNGQPIQPKAQPGDLKFEDYNGDGKIDTNDRQLFGSATPDWTFALNFGFTWKKVSLSGMLQGVAGAQALNCGKMASMSMSSKVHNRTTDIYKSWTFDKNSNVPRLSALDENNNFMTGSSWFLEDASYVRLKNLSVSYDFTDLIRKIRHFDERNSSCLLYFSGENLLTLTKYSGLDPECGQSDFYKYPVSRVLSLGIKLTY